MDILQKLFEPMNRSTLRLCIEAMKLFGVLINMIINDLDVLENRVLRGIS
jgi:hypothetical protein